MSKTSTLREDVIKISYEVDKKQLEKVNDDIDKMAESAQKFSGSGGLGKILNGFERLTKAAKDFAKTHINIKKVADTLKNTLAKAASAAYKGLKKVAGVSFKSLSVSLGAAATAVGYLGKQSVTAYANTEQLVGGIETLFKDSAPTMQKYANDAFKTAGLSANEYMDTVTSFSASLVSSLGGDTQKAAEYANTAMVDMADNANKMGTDMESIQNAYQGFAKQNYTMLDNLKLGYGGTKEEMQRLLADAQELSGVKYDISSYADIVDAIHVVQEEMGIAGTTAKEAEGTISGSLNMVKAAWGNLMPALIQGDEIFDQCIENLIYSAKAFGKNIMPAIKSALSGVGKLVEELGPIIAAEFPALAEEMLPPLLDAAGTVVQGVIKALPSIVSVLAKELPRVAKMLIRALVDTFSTQFPAVEKIGDFLTKNIKTILAFIPAIIGAVTAFKGFEKIKSILSIFGGQGKGKGKGKKDSSGGLFGNIVNAFKDLAKAKTTTVLKGMANLGIIVGGFTALTAIVLAAAPYFSKLTDTQTAVKMIALIGLLGLVGTGLAKLAGIVGKIPVAIVAKGLTNIAIIIGGMTALFVVIGAASLLDFDLTRILKIVGIIGALGLVGSAMAGFAGLIGLIPIPVVLSGLANIALVIGGLTAIVVAFGELSRIPKFNEFIEKGGDILANLFEQIGKIGGALVGGFGEKLSSYLPEIGKNLTAFAQSIQPMFTVFSGVDIGSIGTFFKSFGDFMLSMAGNGLASILTGGTDLAGIGTELCTFATNAEGFFTKVADYPENGFTNATKLFDTLAGLKSLPKEGGVKGWFNGDISYASISSGLKQLSNDKVTGFFAAVAELPQAGFDNAATLFDTLAGLKSLPKDGGVKQWFSGSIDFAGIASGLGQLGKKKVIGFFTSVAELPQAAFDNMKSLFGALAGIGDLPKTDGLAQWFSGETSLGTIADDMASFSEKTAGFFEQINNADINKINGLWESLQKSEDVTASVSKTVDKKINELVDKISKLPSKMGEGLKSAGSSLSNALVQIWKDAVKASAKPVNKVIEGANWILKEFGSDKRIASWTPYARGTDGHKGGNALVNDGRGAELVQMPNGRTFIPQGRNVLIPGAPKGMKVLPAEQTAQLMGRTSPTFRYANGTGDLDVWKYIDNAKGLVSAMSNKFVDYKDVSGLGLHIGKGMVTTITGQMSAWVKKLFDEMGGMSINSYVASKGVEQWRSTVIRALKMEGLYSAANVERTLFQMQTESGGNPRAINLWDINAKRGTPSKGLMQVIDPTFRAYARPGFNTDIWDPLSNILASIRYAVATYGSLARAYRGVGYANGGIVTKPHFGLVGEAGDEAIIPLSASKRKQGIGLWAKAGQMLGLSQYSPEQDSGSRSSGSVEYNTISPQFNLTVSGTQDDRATARRIKRYVSEAIKETFESLERKSRVIREV